MKRIPMHGNPDIAWLVGILEGEGTFGYYARTQRMRINMVDGDVIGRVADIVGHIIGARPPIHMAQRENKSNRQEQYSVTLSGGSARTIMEIIVPYMSERRRQQIWRSLNRYNEPIDNTINLVKLLRIGEVA